MWEAGRFVWWWWCPSVGEQKEGEVHEETVEGFKGGAVLMGRIDASPHATGTPSARLAGCRIKRGPPATREEEDKEEPSLSSSSSS